MHFLYINQQKILLQSNFRRSPLNNKVCLWDTTLVPSLAESCTQNSPSHPRSQQKVSFMWSHIWMGLSVLASFRHREQVISQAIKSTLGLLPAWPQSNQMAENRYKIKEKSGKSHVVFSHGWVRALWAPSKVKCGWKTYRTFSSRAFVAYSLHCTGSRGTSSKKKKKHKNVKRK